MTVICNNCSATYQIDPNKMKAQNVKFECKTCGNLITVNKGDLIDDGSAQTFAPEPAEKTARKPAEGSETRIKGFGIRFKLFFFLIILIVAFAIQAVYLIMQLNKITDRFGKQGTEIIKEMAEKDILATAESVAKQVKLYLEAHPGLSKEDFMSDARFRDIAIQRVGKSGYTALYENAEGGLWKTWAHTNPNIIAPKLDDMSKLREPMGVNFPGFWKVLTEVKSGRPSKGYYKWQEPDKSFKDKYMACVNIVGSSFNIASTTYIDEFTEPMIRLEQESKAIAKAESLNNAILISVIIIVLAVIVFLFGGRLTSNIKYLSEMTDRISLGDLDALIEIRSKDELAVLTESISRLQQSVKLSMQRLRK